MVGITDVFGITISDYSTKYYYGNANSTTIYETSYRTGSDNKVTLYAGTAPTYSDSETFNGFYNQINYTLTKGSIYTLSLTVSYSNLFDSEWGVTNINNRLLSTDFAHCSHCTITAVSGSIRRYNASAPLANNLYDYVVTVNYTFIATSDASIWYIGSYTGDDRTMGVYEHQYTSVVMVNNLNLSNDNNSTIINQNDTIIDQNNQIIEQNEQNTQDIINNQNQNTQDIINSNQVCDFFDKNNIIKENYVVASNGSDLAVNGFGITDYIRLTNKDTLTLLSASTATTSSAYFCFYNLNKNYISCLSARYLAPGEITIPDNTSYVRFSINLDNNRPQFKLCKNGNQALNDSITGLNDSLNDDNSSGATSEASEFFSSFTTNTFGLTSIITAPLNLIQSLTSSTCSELHLPLPYLNNKYLDLPCMTTIYQTHFGSFFTMYQTITYGIIAYWVIVRIFNQVKDFKNPEHDEIEVVDL